MGCLYFQVNWNGIQLINKNVEEIVIMTQPKTNLQVHAFAVLVNKYRYMWSRRSHLLQPSTALTSDKVTFQWTYVEQQAFDKIVQKVARDTFLRYPDFNEPF